MRAGSRTQEIADGWCYKTYAYNLGDPSASQPSGWIPSILCPSIYCSCQVLKTIFPLVVLLFATVIQGTSVALQNCKHGPVSGVLIANTCCMSARLNGPARHTVHHKNLIAGTSGISHQQMTITKNSHGSAKEQRFGLITLKLALNLFEGATGCHEWEAGFLLAEFVFSNPEVFKGRTQTCW